MLNDTTFVRNHRSRGLAEAHRIDGSGGLHADKSSNFAFNARAKRLIPRRVGKALRSGQSEIPVISVAADVRQSGLAESVEPAMDLPTLPAVVLADDHCRAHLRRSLRDADTV
jgi:hypothetical protein